jgi:NAD(P)-dependent dehydrogenase (short-subunit alcohol dehydrogenase family)
MMSATLPEGVRFGKSVLINPWVVSLSEIQNAKSLDEPQMKTRQIFLFRHGQTDWNKEGRIQACIRQTPTGKMTTPEDVGEFVSFLCTSRMASQFVGQTFTIDGGKCILA